ncbi:MAG: MerR family transcriptional regulator [Cytophagaceae bacterium]|nr:MerR family transcriptional regulator [Cytophagaceae bacterium]MDW8457233.1 MerR family transcriptional regulator [Cytophagaceae bacterium]
MPYREKKVEKKYYSIGEVACMFKVQPSLIRFWEKEFGILRPKKNKKGNRQFTKEDIETFKTIYHLVKEKGYTLQGAKERIKESAHASPEKKEILNSLINLKNFLIELREKL